MLFTDKLLQGGFTRELRPLYPIPQPMKKKTPSGRRSSRSEKPERSRPAARKSSGSSGPARPGRPSSRRDFGDESAPRERREEGPRFTAARRSGGYKKADNERSERPARRSDSRSGADTRSFRKDESRDERPYRKNDERSTGGRGGFRREERSDERPFRKSAGRTGGERGGYSRDERGDDRPFRKSEGRAGSDRGGFRKDDRGDERPFRKSEGRSGDDRGGFRKDDRSSERPFRKSEGRAGGDRGGFRKDDRGDERPFRRDDDRGPAKRGGFRSKDTFEEAAPRKRYDKPDDGFQRTERSERSTTRKSAPRSSGWDDDAEFTRPESNRGRSYGDRESEPAPRKPRTGRPDREERHAHFEQKRGKREAFRSERPKRKRNASEGDPLSGEIRLNRFLAMSGIGSRRETDELITAGLVTVNGKLVTELGTKVMPGDDVRYNGERIRNEKLVYILLNKPKDYITTAEDPDARKTVMELIDGACKERVYPVGRLDRNTTGLLLFTNDGDLAKYLTHPSSRVKKIYHVEVDKNVKVADMRRLTEGVELEDGISSVDDVSYEGDGKDKKSVGVELHSGKNRVVRRLFEALGYEVRKLDRVAFAGLTKKDLPRGRWRKLEEKEIGFLKMMGTGKKKKAKEVEAE